MKFKKSLLALGTVATVAAPVAAVVSCGSDDGVRNFPLLPTYTGQADQLIALGIKADYYPLQLNVHNKYGYLTNPAQYMTEQTADFQGKFKTAVNKYTPKTVGESWWNQDAQNSDDERIDNTYWQKQEGSVLLYEHYLLDDDRKVVEQSWAPKHNEETAIQTNFRASRDPYTRLPKAVFYGWDLAPSTLDAIISGSVSTTDLKYVDAEGHGTTKDTYFQTAQGKKGIVDPAEVKAAGNKVTVTLNGDTVEITPDSAKVIQNMRKMRAAFVIDKATESEWFYNDWFFVDSYHRTYLDNKDFQNGVDADGVTRATAPANGGEFTSWTLDSTKANPFDRDATTAGKLQSLFDASTYTENEVQHGVNPHSTAAGKPAPHHPIYEQQGGTVGAAPMFEGAMRDNQLYLFNISWQVSNLAKYGTPYGKAHYDELPATTPAGAADSSLARSKAEADKIKAYVKNHVTAEQYTEMEKALVNGQLITSQLNSRMAKIAKFFEDINVKGKKFGLLTIAPSHGVSTIQTMSKYSFIYDKLGLSQPLPANLDDLAAGAKLYTGAWKDQGTATATNTYLSNGVVSATGGIQMPAFDTKEEAIKFLTDNKTKLVDTTGATGEALEKLGKISAADFAKLQAAAEKLVNPKAGEDADFGDFNDEIAEVVNNYNAINGDANGKKVMAAVGGGSIFNMDDNGWFWNVGETAGVDGGTATGGLSSEALNEFKGQFDFGVIASHDENYDAEIVQNSGIQTKLAEIFSTYSSKANGQSDLDFVNAQRKVGYGTAARNADYDLWNEGLKTPFVMHMLLDEIMTKALQYAAETVTVSGTTTVADLKTKFKADYDAAAGWGSYFSTDYLK